MSDLIAALSKVHDNFILSYAVDFQEHTLKLKTQNANGNQILLTFDGLLAHNFDHVALWYATIWAYQRNEKRIHPLVSVLLYLKQFYIVKT